MIPMPRLWPILLALAVLAADVPVVHQHTGSEPGLFNEECPLARLAAGTGARALAPVPDLPGPAPAVNVALPAWTPVPASLPLLALGARAPPPAC